MEDVLELYAQDYEAKRPLVCIDEKGKELQAEVRPSLEMQPGQPRRVDYEYRREGSCNIFVAYGVKQGWRKAWVTERRQALDMAAVFKELVDEIYPEAEVVRVVCDNLNIHGPGSLYERYEASEARRIARKLEFHYTPTHASWLNMVEIELGILDKQCLKGRKASVEEVRQAVEAWEGQRNAAQASIKWQFSCESARTKFQRFYPQLD